MKNTKQKINIAIIGTGYVGLVTGACLAQAGHNVVCVDNNREKVKNLKEGKIPIFEPGLKEIVLANLENKRLTFKNILKKALSGIDVVFIAVGTPSSRRGDGYADLSYVYDVAKDLADHLKQYKLIVNKSTVPIGTADEVKRIILEKNPKAKFDVASNPEFLREGMAVDDFMYPDRVVAGVNNKKSLRLLKKIYDPILKETQERFKEEKKGVFHATDIRSAELIKYSSNAFLALKISYINEIANLCEKVNANIDDVAEGMGLDKRICPYFLNPGPGYGGSCFPKDVTALLRIAQENDSALRILESVFEVNIAQKARMIKKIKEGAKIENKEKTLIFLGLTFKPDTDDMRESAALTIIPSLIEKGHKIIAHDPKGLREAKKMLPSEVEYFSDLDKIYDISRTAQGIVLLTEWREYKTINLDKLQSNLKEANFIDLRNLFNPEKMKKIGFNYSSIGR